MTYHMLHYFVDTLMFFMYLTVLLENCATLVVLMSAYVTFDLRNKNKRQNSSKCKNMFFKLGVKTVQVDLNVIYKPRY